MVLIVTDGEGLRVLRDVLGTRVDRPGVDLVAVAVWSAATAVRGAASVRVLRTEVVDLAGDFGAALVVVVPGDLAARAALAAVGAVTPIPAAAAGPEGLALACEAPTDAACTLMVSGLRPASEEPLASFEAADSRAVILLRTDMTVPVETFLADEAADGPDAALPVCPGPLFWRELSPRGGLRSGRRAGGLAGRCSGTAAVLLTVSLGLVRTPVDESRVGFEGVVTDRSEEVDRLPFIGCLPADFAEIAAALAVATVLAVVVVVTEATDLLGEDALATAALPDCGPSLGVLGLLGSDEGLRELCVAAAGEPSGSLDGPASAFCFDAGGVCRVPGPVVDDPGLGAGPLTDFWPLLAVGVAGAGLVSLAVEGGVSDRAGVGVRPAGIAAFGLGEARPSARGAWGRRRWSGRIRANVAFVLVELLSLRRLRPLDSPADLGVVLGLPGDAVTA